MFAVKKRPPGEQAPLYHAPCPNVHADGRICPGRTPFPPCTPQNIGAALAGRRRFPLAELVPVSAGPEPGLRLRELL